MKAKGEERLQPYEEVENWPPYTYREYPEVTVENIRAFTDFLETENNVGLEMELQPWISFCDSKCTFCYFPNETFSKEILGKYLVALKKELKMYAETRYIRSSFFDEVVLGGGSPSVLSPHQLVDLLSFCEENFDLTEDLMVKVAGCTHNFDIKKLRAISDFAKKIGTRCAQIDLGVQTFDDSIRKMLNILDSADEAVKTIETVRKMGLYACIDLMYNLPGETMDVLKRDVDKAMELDVEGIDFYALDVLPGTPLEKRLKAGKAPPIGDSDMEKEMYLEGYQRFRKGGYGPTGHNRFSRVEEHFTERCVAGWPWAGQLTTGAGCFMGYLGKFSWVNTEPASTYIDTVSKGVFPIAKLSVDSKLDRMGKVMTRLYVRQPVDKLKFKKEFGIFPEEAFPKAIERLTSKGLIAVDDREIRLTEAGDFWRYNIIWEFCKS
ncbi:MAG: radical SAM protein [Candidatus Bathyarchaeota archaeon]|nr:radical SAM protein [Candidatus Bathyarchaeota archaeon]